MGALEEVLIDLILHESIQSISDLLCLRILKLHLRLNFEVLRLVILLVGFAFFRYLGAASILLGKRSSIMRQGATAAIWIIAVVEFVRMNELELVLVFVICLDELIRKISLKRLVVR